MKQALSLVIMIIVLSCANDKTDASKTESPSMTPPVENVDGNLPDSTNNINSAQQPIDSTGLRDSVPR